jgi:hypothetical protein
VGSREGGRKWFFLERKNQRTFVTMGLRGRNHSGQSREKSFCFFFRS